MRDFSPLAQAKGREFLGISPQAEPGRLAQEVDRLTDGRGCDDIVVVAPDTTVIEQALPYLADDGMLVLFAGVPVGNRIALPLDRVSLHKAQFTGTSGSTVSGELRIVEQIQAGTLSPARSVAAIGGLKAIAKGLQAVMERIYPGKIVIFPQLLDLPLLSLAELNNALPEVYARLGPGETWTARAEQTLFEHYL
jgi:threonine dehydrogenase-like Zn-dependent dehydrogenase